MTVFFDDSTSSIPLICDKNGIVNGLLIESRLNQYDNKNDIINFMIYLMNDNNNILSLQQLKYYCSMMIKQYCIDIENHDNMKQYIDLLFQYFNQSLVFFIIFIIHT